MNNSLRFLTSLDKIAEISGGSTPKRDEQSYWNGSIPWVTPTDLPMPGQGIIEITSTKERLTSSGLGACSAKLLPPGSVLYSSRATIGKIAIAGTELATNQGFINFTPLPYIYNRYLAYFLQFYTDQIFLLAGSTTFKEVTRGALKKFKIDLPPLSEQKKIVEILDQADALRKKRAESDRLSDRILPALFIKMFGDPATNPKNFEVKTLKELQTDFSYGTSARCTSHPSTPHDLPVLRIPNILKEEIDCTDLKHTSLSQKEINKLTLKKGDLLFVRTNGNPDYVGRCAVFDLPEYYLFASYLIRARLNQEEVNPWYLSVCLQTSQGRKVMLPFIRTTAGQSNISVEGLKQISVPVPHISSQRKFESHLREIYQLRSQSRASVQLIEKLFQTLLHQAFTGTLTAAWRTAHMTELLQEMEHQAKQLNLDLSPIP